MRPVLHRVSLAALALSALIATPALAQTAPPTSPTPGARSTSPRSRAAQQTTVEDVARSQTQAPSEGGPDTLTGRAAARAAAIEVDDPLLTPVAPAKRVLRGWRDALTLARARSQNLRIAVDEVERAEGLARQALGRALPQAAATASIDFALVRSEPRTGLNPQSGTVEQQRFPISPITIFQLTASQPVLAPRAWYAIGTARKNTAVAHVNLEEQKRLVMTSIAASVVSVVTSERISEVNRVGLRGSLQTLELTKRRSRLGTGTRLDVVRAQQDVELARATLITGDESLRQAREALGLALGVDDQYGIDPNISMDGVIQSMQSVCAPGAPEARSDVRLSRAQIALAKRDVGDANLLYLPTADVRTVATLSPLILQTGRHYSWSVQGVLTLPIWDGGTRYGLAKSARAAARQQEQRFEATLRTATIEGRRAVRGVTVADSARVVAESSRDLARDVARLSQVAFEAGTATSFDLVESARRAREAELQLALREFELVRAKLTALLATSSCNF